jgi:hypothetical protein
MRGEWPANLLWSVTLNRSTLGRRRSETVISGHLCSGSGAGAAAFNDGYLESVRTSAFGQEQSTVKWGCSRSTFDLRGMPRQAGACLSIDGSVVKPQEGTACEEAATTLCATRS